MFSEMIRVGTLRAGNTIIQGLIVDKIAIMGLSTNYDTKFGILVNNEVNFFTDKPQFLIEDKLNFITGFVATMQWLDTTDTCMYFFL